jgi:exodeoxyribonuclease VII large subunit
LRAEIAQYNVARGNHYINLVEKETDGDIITAEAEAVIWRFQYAKIASELEVPVKEILQEGMEVLIRVQPEFHERYGYKLVISEIDSAFTIGKLALERKKVVEDLRSKGLLHLNASNALPSVIQNVAILSTDTAAGYQDFMAQVSNNRFGYIFRTKLFKTAMQGENTVSEALQNLKRIRRSVHSYDCVIIIRGGGAKLTLKAFDDFSLSEAIAKFPIPVLSGIGHERDESVLDMVAHSSLKTPTAVAEFIVQHNFSFENELFILGRQLEQIVSLHLVNGKMKLKNAQVELKHKTEALLSAGKEEISQLESVLPKLINRKLKQEQKELQYAILINNLLDVENTLGRGFSLTTTEKGKLLTSTEDLNMEDLLVTRLKKGSVGSTINDIKIK